MREDVMALAGEAEGEAASALTPAAEVPEAPLEAQAGADTKDILQEPPPSLPSPPPVAPARQAPPPPPSPWARPPITLFCTQTALTPEIQSCSS